MSNIKFSLNVYIAEEMELDICLKSIFEENKRELAHMQVLLLDACNDRDTKEVIAKYKEQYGSAITYVDCKGLSQAEAYNKAKELWTGEYIAFITGNIQYAEGALVEVEHFIKKHDASIVSLVPRFYNANGAAKKYLKFGRYDEMVDLTEDIYKVNLFANGYFIRKDITAKLEFNPAIIHNAMECYLIHALEMEKTYGIVPKLIYTHTPPEVDYYNYADQYYKTWYTDHVRTLIIPILEEDHARFVQFSMLYLLMIKFACNMNDRHKAILNKAELDEFMESIKDALQLIDDDIISQYDTPYKRVLPRFMGLNLLRVKYDEYDLKTEMKEINDPFTDEPTVAGVYKDTVIESFNNVSLYVKAINYDKGELVIDGEIANVYFLDYDAIQVTAEVEGKKVVGTRNYIYSLVKYFNQSVRRGYTFQIKIPVEHITGKTKFNLMLNYAGHTMPLPISFKKVQARLYEKFSMSYWCFGNYMLSYSNKKQQLIIKKKNAFKVIGQELLFMLNFLIKGKSLARSVKSVILRALYWMTKPYFKNKEVWLTFDQLFKGGDNGEYFYRYVSEREDKGNIKIYYVLNKTAPEYERLQSKYKTVLPFNSIKHKVVSLHADVVFATRVDVKLYCGYWAALEKYVRDLFNAEITCLQHGLTIQRIAQYQNRLFDNTKLYFCVSPYEIKNLSNPVYGYEGKELILTGAPRFDGLISNDQRYILISPTWRRNVTAGTNKKGNMHEYSVNFKHTEYFRIYNSLINDERLIDAAKKYNYRIKYLIHPILSPQIKDFTTNEYVDIIAGAGDISYEKMLTEASLMLTDHSGIQFDFANMRKPLVYYHPDTLPAQYEEGGLKYDTMGFGPVCRNHTDVVDKLCDYMAHNCEMKEEYRRRIDEFFAYTDTNNCQRVYEAAIAYFNKK